MAKQDFNFVQQGFDAIDQSLASGDPGIGALIDEWIDKLAPAVARNQNVPLSAVKSAARFAINGRVEQTFNQQQKSSKVKTGALQQVGAAERQSQVQLQGLAKNEAAFKRKIGMMYAGAAVNAAGQFAAEGLRSGAFTKETPNVDLDQLSAQTAGQIEAMPDRVGRAHLRDATTLELGKDRYSALLKGDRSLPPREFGLTQALEKPSTLGSEIHPPEVFQSTAPASAAKRFKHRTLPIDRQRMFNPMDDEDELRTALNALRGL